MSLYLWFLLLIISLAILVKASDFFTASAEKLGLAYRISKFIIGITIVSIGTSLPELISSIIATLRGIPEFAASNVIGSNIANILLVVGLSSIVVSKGALKIKRNLIDLDLPVLALATTIFLIIGIDAKITLFESIILLIGFVIFLTYTFSTRWEEEVKEKVEQVLPEYSQKEKLSYWAILVVSAIFIYLGAEFVVKSVEEISLILNISRSFLIVTVVALGTSLPELVVSVIAAYKKLYEMSLGNIIGSCVFNLLAISGISRLFGKLNLDSQLITVGFPFLIIATLLLIFSGISQKIHRWEGAMYILIYILFIGNFIITIL